MISDAYILTTSFYDRTSIDSLIARTVQVKVDIVEQDPFEEDIRRYLNLGHTFAHAVEKVSNYQWFHGEAVAVGLLAAAHFIAFTGSV